MCAALYGYVSDLIPSMRLSTFLCNFVKGKLMWFLCYVIARVVKGFVCFQLEEILPSSFPELNIPVY